MKNKPYSIHIDKLTHRFCENFYVNLKDLNCVYLPHTIKIVEDQNNSNENSVCKLEDICVENGEITALLYKGDYDLWVYTESFNRLVSELEDGGVDEL